MGGAQEERGAGSVTSLYPIAHKASMCSTLSRHLCARDMGVCGVDMSRLLIPVLLCGVCVCARAVQQRDYGVKLCGREFIRAVIFTCGGSRWRRATDLEPPGQDPNPQLSSQEGDEQLGWIKSNHADKLSSILYSSPPLSDHRRAMVAQRNPRDESRVSEEVQGSWLESLFSSRPLGHERVKSLDLGWFHEDRKRRNYSLGLAGLCCSQGCTKNDIGRLC